MKLELRKLTRRARRWGNPSPTDTVPGLLETLEECTQRVLIVDSDVDSRFLSRMKLTRIVPLGAGLWQMAGGEWSEADRYYLEMLLTEYRLAAWFVSTRDSLLVHNVQRYYSSSELVPDLWKLLPWLSEEMRSGLVAALDRTTGTEAVVSFAGEESFVVMGMVQKMALL